MLHFLYYLKLRRDILNHAYLKRVHIVAFAFVGVVVGAGFATGQEIFQFSQVMAHIAFQALL